MPTGRRLRPGTDHWPGFVDALATLLMVIVFVVMVFALAQFFLGQALTGREQQLVRLGRELTALTDQLALERNANTQLQAGVARLTEQLTASVAERDRLSAKGAELDARLSELYTRLAQAADETAGERKLTDEARVRAQALEAQIAALKDELARVAAALDASEKAGADQKIEIANLGKRLNVALAGKVEELQRYRSEFFGRLRKVLGNRPGIRIEGDRFIFQSELLFDTASAELGPDGTAQVRKLAATLKELSAQIPPGVKWVLRIDGHTDRRPISGRFASNWELSTARAITVVRTLIAAGIPADRLAAAGFGEYQPLDPADNEPAWGRNRRIEIRLDQR